MMDVKWVTVLLIKARKHQLVPPHHCAIEHHVFNTPTVICLGALSCLCVEKSSLLPLYQADYSDLHHFPWMLPSKKKVTISEW